MWKLPFYYFSCPLEDSSDPYVCSKQTVECKMSVSVNGMVKMAMSIDACWIHSNLFYSFAFLLFLSYFLSFFLNRAIDQLFKHISRNRLIKKKRKKKRIESVNVRKDSTTVTVVSWVRPVNLASPPSLLMKRIDVNNDRRKLRNDRIGRPKVNW